MDPCIESIGRLVGVPNHLRDLLAAGVLIAAVLLAAVRQATDRVDDMGGRHGASH
jgi:hypothetical protein